MAHARRNSHHLVLVQEHHRLERVQVRLAFASAREQQAQPVIAVYMSRAVALRQEHSGSAKHGLRVLVLSRAVLGV